MRRITHVIVCSLFLVGCSSSTQPLDTGTAVSGTVWKHSLLVNVGQNEGTTIPQDATVDVYDHLIVVRFSDGTRQIVPFDHVSELKISN